MVDPLTMEGQQSFSLNWLSDDVLVLNPQQCWRITNQVTDSAIAYMNKITKLCIFILISLQTLMEKLLLTFNKFVVVYLAVLVIFS